ncbi:hypothetical protein Cgig2_026444 [Carnegiea gigantea]|uniref:Uncharacterized protein n=1 Tax=Carnegiea gigantea TaxID=171969 RepID=A0A9Q1KQD6_9CARY|nr:hypothetical protein Cgig2_026444 [Carnegiea gigantea]
MDNYERRHVIDIDLNEEIEEFNDNVEKRIDLNEEAEGMNEEVEKEQIDMGEELNEDSDGSNNTDKVPDPCVGMCFDNGQELAKYCHKYASSRGYITPYHKRRILNNDAAGVPITKNFNSLVIESGRHENLPFNERDMRNEVFHKAYSNSKFKEVQEEAHGLMHTNANKVTEEGSLKIYEVTEKIYLKSLALHNDATYTMVMEGTNELCKRLECTLGI